MISNFFKFCVLFLTLISCNSTEEEIKSAEVNIANYQILENSTEGIKTQTYIDFIGEGDFTIENHGVVWYKKSGVKKQINKGLLNGNEYFTKISSYLLKDSVYKTYPFVKFKNKLIYGDTLEFISTITSTIFIEDFTPKRGFINDTIQLIGKNFCTDDFENKIIYNNKGFLNIISKSDTLIKATIPSYLSKSELNLSLISCNINTPIKDVFLINEPTLDAIKSTEKYVNDTLTLYGKNIHSSISEVWLDNIKTQVIYSNSIDSLSIKIPKKLSVGKVDLKLKVLDRIIEKSNFFQTTSPYIKEFLPTEIGFLDTLLIKGNYFKQNDSKIDVYIGNSKQKILEVNNNEIKLLIDRYFYDENPKLKLEFTDFVVEKEITMLPPFIKSFNKEKYHLNDTDFIIKTDNFLDDDIEVGGRKKNFGVKSEVDIQGNLMLSLESWLNITSYSWSYYLTEPGSLEIKIETQFGEDSKFVKIYKPVINSVNGTAFLAGDQIVLSGNDFAYRNFTKVYIDDEEVPFLGNSAYTLNNSKIAFPLILNTTSGTHKLYVVTAGQKSNTIEYSIKKTDVYSLNKKSGTRKDIYKISGNNLRNLNIEADDSYINIISKTEELITFNFPYFKKLKPSFNIKANSGDQNFDLGSFNGIEPFDTYDQAFGDNVLYYKKHITFSDSENWYYCNNDGVYKFSFTKNQWEVFDTSAPPFNTPIFGESAFVSLENGIAKYVNGSILYTYNTSSKKWNQKNLNNVSFKTGVVVGDFIFGKQYNKNDFLKYNLQKDSFQEISLPSDLNISFENITLGDNKIFINPVKGSAYYFDTINNTWTKMGRPRGFFGTYNNVALKYYNGSLYFSGGFTDGGIEYRLYEYNMNTNVWEEKVPMLQKLISHAMFVRNNKIYFSLGMNQNYTTNSYIQIYNINEDPH